ncbi:MAG: putative hydro-lyase [Hormoscilla sp. SP5CHS1]|nr:putative hydro-lyase [Hormoscilla sp. SP5CHS1]MBC6475204.1 putative hydro-lyase [Hormoscilla sp. GM102CHS1]MBC6480995.1 putative hydro-lyase [Hormoscilla sp. GM7CHS1pb]
MNSLSTAAEVRSRARSGELSAPTPGLAPGYVQANLVVLPKSLAFDFLLFCQRNPKPCPVLDVTDVGNPEPRLVAPGSDLRTDLPRYRVFQQGELIEETTDIRKIWRDDLVAFLIGCSFTFEAAMLKAGLPVRHLDEGKNVPMYRTTIPCVSAGSFAGRLVVSMRPLSPAQAIQAVQLTTPYTKAHGAPVHLGDPAAIGITQLDAPDFGDAVTLRDGEIPVFWACGVTTQATIGQTQPELAITHAPGHMFVTDLKEDAIL